VCKLAELKNLNRAVGVKIKMKLNQLILAFKLFFLIIANLTTNNMLGSCCSAKAVDAVEPQRVMPASSSLGKEYPAWTKQLGGSRLAIVKSMIDGHTTIDDHGNTILHYAIERFAPTDEIERYIEGGANVNHANNINCEYSASDGSSFYWGRETPLYCAVARNRLDVIILLLRYGADPELKAASGLSPFLLSSVMRSEAEDRLQENIAGRQRRSRWDEKKGWIEGCVQIGRSEELK
jgi:hypothetical protein